MARWITAAVVIACTLTLTSAQRRTTGLTTEKRGDAWVLKLDAEGEARNGDLVRIYAETQSVTALHDARKLGGVTKWNSPPQELAGNEIELFVANALEAERIVLCPSGANQVQAIALSEAVTRAPYVQEADLETISPAAWVIVIYRCIHVEPNALRGSLHQVMTRQAGSMYPVSGVGLMICDRADRVKNMLKIAREIDVASEAEFRVYMLPAGMKPDTVCASLWKLFPTCRFAPTPDGKRVVGRVRADDDDAIKKAIEAMK